MENIASNRYIEKLFSDHQVSLLGYLRKKLNGRSECAEDIAQEAYVRLCKLNNVASIQYPKAHLYKMASNLAVDYQRREKLKRAYADNLAVEPELACEETPVRVYELEKTLLKLDSEVNKLPKKCRQALVLHRVYGMGYSEIASRLSVSVSSVEKYLTRGIYLCRKVIDRH